MKETLLKHLFDKIHSLGLDIISEDSIIDKKEDFSKMVSKDNFISSFSIKKEDMWELELQLFGCCENIERAWALINTTIEEFNLSFEKTKLYFKYIVKYSI